jgi:hypothetical protein
MECAIDKETCRSFSLSPNYVQLRFQYVQIHAVAGILFEHTSALLK